MHKIKYNNWNFYFQVRFSHCFVLSSFIELYIIVLTFVCFVFVFIFFNPEQEFGGALLFTYKEWRIKFIALLIYCLHTNSCFSHMQEQRN